MVRFSPQSVSPFFNIKSWSSDLYGSVGMGLPCSTPSSMVVDLSLTDCLPTSVGFTWTVCLGSLNTDEKTGVSGGRDVKGRSCGVTGLGWPSILPSLWYLGKRGLDEGRFRVSSTLRGPRRVSLYESR